MNRLVCLVLVGVLLATAVLPADARPATEPGTGSHLAYYGLSFLIASPELQKELKVSADQVNKLNAAWTLTMSGLGGFGEGRVRETPGETLRATDKALTETLQPGQIKRLKQIVLQQLDKSPLAVKIPEIVVELKLTEDQQKKLNEGSALISILTDAQKGTWQTMVGEKFAGALHHRASVRTLLPLDLQHTQSKSVQDDLKLTAAQQKQIAELRRKWQEAFGFPSLARATDPEPIMVTASLKTDEAVLRLLDPAQVKRLRQIELQLGEGGEQTLFARPKIVAELKLTPGQQEKLKSIQEERRKDMIPLFLTGETTETIAKHLKTHKKETHERLTKILDADQQARLREMIGTLFQGEVDSFAALPRLPAGTRLRSARPPVSLRYLELKPVQDELKMTEAQIKKLPELTKTWEDLVKDRLTWSEEDYLRKMEEAREMLDKALASLLDAKQLTRFHQIELQQRPGLTTLLRLVKVQKELQLSQDQITRITSIYNDRIGTSRLVSQELLAFRRGGAGFVGPGMGAMDEEYLKIVNSLSEITEKKLKEVLTAGQQEKLKALLGKPFQSELRLRGGPNAVPGGPAPLPPG